jgi:dephospho-CoA kinase
LGGNALTVIGITGPYASGKSTVAGELEKRGWYQIEVDKLGHLALESRREEVIRSFGAEILDRKDGGIDRRKLGSLVFADPEALARLETIVHPEMVRQTARIIEERREIIGKSPVAESRTHAEPPPGIIINAAILYKMGLDSYCDLVFWIDAPKIVRALRARRRDSLPWKEIFKRIRSQNSMNAQLEAGNVDMYRVDNRSLSAAVRRIDEILQGRVWSRTRPTSSSSS